MFVFKCSEPLVNQVGEKKDWLMLILNESAFTPLAVLSKKSTPKAFKFKDYIVGSFP